MMLSNLTAMSKEFGNITIKGIGKLSIKDRDSLEIARTFLEILRSKVTREKELKLITRFTKA